MSVIPMSEGASVLLEEGQKILIVHRRLFEQDRPRFFVGVVDGYELGIAKVSGYSWVKNAFVGRFIEKQDRRCKLFSLLSGTLIAYVLPDTADLSKLAFEADIKGGIYLTDHEDFKMDLSEKEYGNSK